MVSDGYTTDIAQKQFGGTEYWKVGAKSNEAQDFIWRTFQRSLALADADRVAVYDHFLGDTLLDAWDLDTDSDSGSIGVTGTGNGIATIATGSTIGDHCTLAYGLHWQVADGKVDFEAKVASATVATNRKIEIGLSDAVSETSGMAFSSHDATIVAVADNAIVFALDTAESVTDWKVCSVAGGGTPQGTDSEVTPVADTYETFRVTIDADQTARCYIDGTLVATVSNAVASTAVLTPWLSIQTESGAAAQINADYAFVSAPVA